MILEKNIIPEIPKWISKQLHRPCWNWRGIVKAIFSNHKERRIKNYIKQISGASKVILTNSGSDAIEIALNGLSILSSCKEVIMPSYCCKTVADSIINCGLIPHFIDIEEDFMISSRTIKSAVNKNTLAIIAPHMYGKNGFFAYIKMSFPNIILIEDKATRIEGHLDGDYGILSFNIGKQVQSIGGGALLIK